MGGWIRCGWRIAIECGPRLPRRVVVQDAAVRGGAEGPAEALEQLRECPWCGGFSDPEAGDLPRALRVRFPVDRPDQLLLEKACSLRVEEGVFEFVFRFVHGLPLADAICPSVAQESQDGKPAHPILPRSGSLLGSRLARIAELDRPVLGEHDRHPAARLEMGAGDHDDDGDRH